MTALSGVYPILSMPFDEARRIDVASLEAEVDHLVAAGVDGVGIALASEVPKLTEAERDLALRTVVARAQGRVKVVMNTGAVGTDLALHYARKARDLGADAVMVLPPPFPDGPASETRAYFHAIAREVSLPLFIQDIPFAPVSPGLAAQIAREQAHPWYLKAESHPTPTRVAEAVALGEGKLTVFGGAGGGFFIEELRRGSVGTMPASACLAAFVGTWRLWREGRAEEAEAYFARFATLLRLFAQPLGIGPALVKETLRLQGIFKTAIVRPPTVPPDDLALRELRQHLEAVGIL